MLSLSVVLLFLGGLSTTAVAATNDRPTQSVTDNSRATTLGIYANNESGIALCWRQLAAGTARFYEPSDTHGFDATARTRPLEANTCARMRVRGGLIGVVALPEGALVNLGLRDGREQAVAYSKCNNWLELLPLPVPVSAPAEVLSLPASTTTINTTPTHETRTVENIVTIRRVTRYVYQDVVEGGPPPDVTVNVPPTVYRYVNVPQPAQVAPAALPRCICYWPPEDPSVTTLYRFPYSDRAGQWWCVPLYMVQSNTPPPGFVR